MSRGHRRDDGNGRVYVEGTIVDAREAYEQQPSRRTLGAVVAAVIVAAFVALTLRRIMSRGSGA